MKFPSVDRRALSPGAPCTCSRASWRASSGARRSNSGWTRRPRS